MKITLLGDSIRLQYQNRVGELLGEGFEVFGPNDNCRFAKYTLRGLFDWKGKMAGSRIVHWNNGLWDICNLFGDGLFSSEEEFADNIMRIADILTERYEKVIFATITPVSEKNIYNKNEDIKRYNDLVVPKLLEKGIIINDLYSLISADIDRYISDDNIHMTEEGIEACARQVAEVISKTAEGLSANEQVDQSVPEAVSAEQGAPVIFD